MPTLATRSVVQSLRRAARVAAAGVVAIGVSALACWCLEEQYSFAVFPGLAALISAGTALTVLLIGAALWLRAGSVDHRRFGLTLAAVVVLLPAARIGAYLTHRDGHLAGSPSGAAARMAPAVALPLLLVGLALLQLDVCTRRGLRPAEPLAVAAGGIALGA